MGECGGECNNPATRGCCKTSFVLGQGVYFIHCLGVDRMTMKDRVCLGMAGEASVAVSSCYTQTAPGSQADLFFVPTPSEELRLLEGRGHPFALKVLGWGLQEPLPKVEPCG